MRPKDNLWNNMSGDITTYENFRYHYDKKENPFNNRIVKNLKEIFLSKTPPSVINFKEWVVEEGDPTMESINQKFGREMIDSINKLDIEMRGVLSKDGGILIPNILQNLDYTGIDDNLKKEGEGDDAFDPLFSPTKEEHRHSQWSPNNRYSTSVDGRSEDVIYGEECFARSRMCSCELSFDRKLLLPVSVNSNASGWFLTSNTSKD
ncbi:hypothetical protein HYC85_016880 [Camellia sinensis]|uniref:Uncharacterized protein n=1 Tax=Camellia sinensis TaxID=4442 RepID=A0A7J7H0V9_CAMSI|nr:hypothetical protein HYC85_016880 [Camellia sinensis]